MSDLDHKYRTEEKDLRAAIRAEAKKIRGVTAEWENLYVLRSPVNGRLSFFKILTTLEQKMAALLHYTTEWKRLFGESPDDMLAMLKLNMDQEFTRNIIGNTCLPARRPGSNMLWRFNATTR
ncbi:hypothetical protein DCC81_09870 [Chitinophaga parva]|uniref:Uncharacterized protein n=1 Tax=Chitinophaga parva TaxID=2169414 RepID=A0A2T7BPX1_9BACT|nr:hypothetical protein [Chitinophaga parva]PUZ29724.1 hypothetical protein DCC81_09870 [Chitinophaga parva]